MTPSVDTAELTSDDNPRDKLERGNLFSSGATDATFELEIQSGTGPDELGPDEMHN